MVFDNKIDLLKARRELLVKISNSRQEEKLSGFEIAALIKSYLQESQDDAPGVLIKLQGKALYYGDKKPIFKDVGNSISKLDKKINLIEKLSEYQIEPPEQKTDLEAKLDLVLKIKDFVTRKEPGYKIVGLIDSYSELIDINSFYMLRDIRDYALEMGSKPLSFVSIEIDRNIELSKVLKKTIIALTEEIYWNTFHPGEELPPHLLERKKSQIKIQNPDLKEIYEELRQVKTDTKIIKGIQTTFLIFFIINLLISFYIGFVIGAEGI